MCLSSIHSCSVLHLPTFIHFLSKGYLHLLSFAWSLISQQITVSCEDIAVHHSLASSVFLGGGAQSILLMKSHPHLKPICLCPAPPTHTSDSCLSYTIEKSKIKNKINKYFLKYIYIYFNVKQVIFG